MSSTMARWSTMVAVLSILPGGLGCTSDAGAPRRDAGTFPGSDAAGSCTPGETRACDCAESASGISTCASSGLWGTCECLGGGPPVLLTPLSTTTELPSLIRVYFTATNSEGLGLTDLTQEDFILTEDGATLSVSESSFTVRKRDAVDGLDLRTVLLLDLSRSVIDAGGLPTLKAAANTIIDGLQPEQSLQIMTFADDVQIRQAFTRERALLHDTINAIDAEQGISTNLYGGVIQALGSWTDGFRRDGGLDVGLLIVLTDGSDTAGVSTLSDALAARGSKRVITVGVGTEIDPNALRALGNYGTTLSDDFGSLEADIATLVANMQRLNDSVYFASYCSPKRGGEHTLEITPVANWDVPYCPPAQPPAGRYCLDDAGDRLDDWLLCTEYCCPPDLPHHCGDRCYETAAAAEEACASIADTCEICGSAYGGGPVPVLVHRFRADGFSSGECVP